MFNRSHQFLAAVLLAIALEISPVSNALAAPKFEYKPISLDTAGVKNEKDLEDFLNKLGADGWELVEINVMRGTAIFKRQK